MKLCYFYDLKHDSNNESMKNNMRLLFGVNALSYDYSASTKCLEKPQKPQYRGGIIINPELDDGLKGWSTFGNAKIRHQESNGNKFIVASNRSQPYDTVSQKLFLQKKLLYTLSAWIQVNKGSNVLVTATLKTTSGFKHSGAVLAQSHCWSFLKGGLTVNQSGPAVLYFESEDTSVEIWIDSISLQPFTRRQWNSHQDQSIQKMRKRNVRIKVVDAQGNPLPNATISIRQKKPSFPIGSAINKNILNNPTYQNWFTSRFTVTTFENEMKWYSTEAIQGKEDYSVPDTMLQFAKRHNISVRGHNVFWEDPRYHPSWLKSIPRQRLSSATKTRLNSALSRYKGQLIAWDVVNENLHFDYFENKMGNNASATFYNWAFEADGETTMFLNEYNTLENPKDGFAVPAKYLKKLREIQSFAGNSNGKMGIGLEAHFGSPNLPYIRSSLDTLSATGLPIWLTELDVRSGPYQAKHLEQILRETFSHPGVEGIVIWAAWNPQGCWVMCLTDHNFKNLPTGDVVDKLLGEWGLNKLTTGKIDGHGLYETSLFHGDYEVKIVHPEVKNSSLAQRINVAPTIATQHKTLLIKVQA
ncbi:hypothetical protein UlMin_031127 [Ulmus minor]